MPLAMKNKFTLIELLIVCAIIAILLSLLLPALARAREKTKRAVCLSNLSQVHKANTTFAVNNNNLLPPPNSVVWKSQGADSTYRVDKDIAFGAAIPYKQEYFNDFNLFYCPSWTQPYMQINKLNDNGFFGGFTEEGNPEPVYHYMTSYAYRGTYGGKISVASLLRQDDDTPYMADHWMKDFGQYVHAREGYNVLYLGGYAKFNSDKTQTVFSNKTSQTNWNQQDPLWDLFFKK